LNPGRNGIDYFIIHNLPNEAVEILLEILNDILRSRVFPDDWKKYRVFFIPKKDKTNLRPISMASCVCMCKVLLLVAGICGCGRGVIPSLAGLGE
jgi:hypothetical protein